MIFKRCLFVLILIVFFVTGCGSTVFHDVTIEKPICNRQIVLMRKGSNCYGAFIPTNQTLNPIGVKYTWYYRKDGKGTFKQSDKTHYKTGVKSLSSDKLVPFFYTSFGPFGFRWSGNEEGKGWIWYSHTEGEPVSPDNVMICITNETNIEKINATDPKWIYKGSPSDPGIRANGKKVSKGH